MASQTIVVPLTSSGIRVLVVDAVLVVLATSWTGLRFYSRWLRKSGIFAEDWLILVSLIQYYGFAIASYLMVIIGGLGHHTAELSLTTITRCLKISFATQVLYGSSLATVKISICVMLARIFFVPLFRIAAITAMLLSAAWGIMTILVGILVCHPVTMNWYPETPGGKCGNQRMAFASVGIVDIVVDIIILLLPIPIVLKLQVPTINKVALVLIFGLGIFTTIIGGIRLGLVLHVDFKDFTYSAVEGHILSMVEPGVGIIIASSIMLRPIFDKVFHVAQSMLRSNNSQQRSSAYSHTYSTSRSQKRGREAFQSDELKLTALDPEFAVHTYVGSGSRGNDTSVLEHDKHQGIHVRTEVRQ